MRELERRFEAARAGGGALVMIEGAAGCGKTRLLAAADALAHEMGLRALRTRGRPNEQGFPFGAAIDLFEAEWADADEQQREELAAGPAHVAAALLEGRSDSSPEGFGEPAFPIIRGLYRLAANLVQSPDRDLNKESDRRGPLAIIVDDLELIDRPSLRLLAYLAARLDRHPIVMLVALRAGEDDTARAELTALRQGRSASLLRPRALSPEGIDRLVRGEFPDADPEFVAACRGATKGNPFLLTELLEHVRADNRPPTAATAATMAHLAPNAVVDAVADQLATASEPAQRLACAVAVLGDGAALPAAAELAELDTRTATIAASSLAEMQLLDAHPPLAFVHSVTRSAVLASMSTFERSDSHQRAAAILSGADAPPEAVAAHLLWAPPTGDHAVVDLLRAAARRSVRRGDTDRAVRLLRRTLDEKPADDVYPDVLAELGEAEARAGFSDAPDRLGIAIDIIAEPRRRAELALIRGRALLSENRYHEAADAFESGLNSLGTDDPALAADLEAAYISAASLVPGLTEQALRRRHRMLEQIGGVPTPEQRLAVAHSVMQDSLRGESQTKVRALADLAWGDGLLLDSESARDLHLSSLTTALLFVDDLERDLEICEAADAVAESRFGHAIVRCGSAWAHYERGDVALAHQHAAAAVDAPDDPDGNIRTAYGALACCALQRGDLDQAEQALTIVDDDRLRATIRYPFLLELRAQLRLAQHRPQEARTDAHLAGATLEAEFGVLNPGALAWRSTAALAELALGKSDVAEHLAAEELELAQRIGVTRVVIRDLRVLGLAAGGKLGIELLERAAAAVDESRPRLEGLLALVDLGGALRRARKRAASREPLRIALNLAHRCGANAIAEHAQVELAATGARPRGRLLTGVQSLTPSERRVAGLAADGMTNKLIAESLFITPKTVEYHLRHIYQKLDVGSRAELSVALAGDDAP